MADVRHRIGLGTVGTSITGKNDINAVTPVTTTDVLTADSTKVTADSTLVDATGQYYFSADSKRFSADSTLI